MKIADKDRPRWRCSKCDAIAVIGDRHFCDGCDGKGLRPAPSLAVERAEKAVVRAMVAYWVGYADSYAWNRLIRAAKLLIDAKDRARRARKESR